MNYNVTNGPQDLFGSIAQITQLRAELGRPEVPYHVKKALLRSMEKIQLDVANKFGELVLNGARYKYLGGSYDIGNHKLQDNPDIQPHLVKAANSVPGVWFDHLGVFLMGRKQIALFTQPYGKFLETGENDHAIWRSFDDLSWHYPGSTTLTVIQPR